MDRKLTINDVHTKLVERGFELESLIKLLTVDTKISHITLQQSTLDSIKNVLLTAVQDMNNCANVVDKHVVGHYCKSRLKKVYCNPCRQYRNPEVEDCPHCPFCWRNRVECKNKCNFQLKIGVVQKYYTESVSKFKALRYITKTLSTSFTKVGRRKWLTRPRQRLNGLTPAQVLEQGNYKQVYELAESIVLGGMGT